MPVINGSPFSDELPGTTGDDTISGGAGNDVIYDFLGNDLLRGEDGNDKIQAAAGRVTIEGGAGDDYLIAGSTVLGSPDLVATVRGGSGRDDIHILGDNVMASADGEDGDDTFLVGPSNRGISLTLGPGADVVSYGLFRSVFAGSVPLRINDFVGGMGGDQLKLGLFEILQNWDQSNPFSGGYLRLVAEGTDTLIQVDVDGGGDGFRDIVRLVDSPIAGIVPFNLDRYDPSGGQTLGIHVQPLQVTATQQQFNGTFGADTVTAGGTDDLIETYSENDLIDAGGGDDRVYSGYGNDTVTSGTGNDTLNDDAGSNYLHAGDGNDIINGGLGFDDTHGNKGDDTVHGGGFDDWVVGGQGNDVLFGDDGGDLCYGQLGSDTIDGGAGDDAVVGGQANDVLDGGAGNDFVTGDRGDDTVTGGLGADTFHTNNVQGLDRVTDFSQAQGDRVLVDAGSAYTLSQVGADTVIDMGGGNQMILVGVQLASLTTGWISGG